jgi:hypothetical protein
VLSASEPRDKSWPVGFAAPAAPRAGLADRLDRRRRAAISLKAHDLVHPQLDIEHTGAGSRGRASDD